MPRAFAVAVAVGVAAACGLALGAFSRGPVWWPAAAVGLLTLAMVWPRERALRMVLDLPPRTEPRLLTEEERGVLDGEVSFYKALRPPLRAAFELRVERFLAEHPIEARDGAVIDTETRVLIAASAAMLLLGRPTWDFPRTRIVVMPGDFEHRRMRVAGTAFGGVDMSVRISQKDLKEAFRNPSDGHHIGLHELAHLLDADSSGADGIPSMLPWNQVPGWLELLRREALKLSEGQSVLDKYGATNDAELFAVAVEAFFEKPQQLRAKHPELYATLAAFFGQDLAG